MRFHTVVCISFLFFFIACETSSEMKSDPAVFQSLEELYETQNYFKLKDRFQNQQAKLSKPDILYFNALIKNAFNKASESNKAINELIENYNSILNDSLKNKLYRTKQLNHINLYEYDEAAGVSDYILTNLRHVNDSFDIEMFENEVNIWRALKDVPKQELFRNADVTIPMTVDKVGLFNIDVSFDEITKDFIFDTGANFSVMIRSLVEELGLTIIKSDFYVTAATGVRVKSDLAFAEALSFGEITLKHVVFLVLDDKDLSFPQIEYFPNGAIGFPVIEALDEIRINTKNQIFVPKTPTAYRFNNFALDGLMPIIAGEYKGDTLLFNFDTGATTTSLYPKFYKEYQKEIEDTYEIQTFTSGSGGGEVYFEGYIIDSLNLKIADSEAILNDLRVHIEDIGDDSSNFHGNFGQDFISQFDEMIISFKHSSVLFK